MRFRKLTSLTNEEIDFIVNDIFNTDSIKDIQQNEKDDTISCIITTGGWGEDDTETLTFEDELILSIPTTTSYGLSVNFYVNNEDILKWKQFCIAKGCNYLFKNNPYIKYTK